MLILIRQLRRRSRAKHIDAQLQDCLRLRQIKSVVESDALQADGCLQPCGTDYRDGFNLLIRKAAPLVRRRFSVAHELCHTFFYELVPEVKFVPHEVDGGEERLCNYGAAELLMPAARIKRSARNTNPGLAMLNNLCECYNVSMEAMLVRLRSLGLWECQLTVWYRTNAGQFALDRSVGGKTADWRWVDDSLLSATWETGSPTNGQTFVEYTDQHGGLRVRPVWYEMTRRGDHILSLWAPRPIGPERDPGLFKTRTA
jgi:hypothetical protein